MSSAPGTEDTYHQRALEFQRLRENPTTWDAEDVAFFANKITTLEPRAAQNVFFRTMRACTDETGQGRMLEATALLLASSPPWRKVLEKSLSRYGRCPRHFRPQVRRLLAHPGAAPKRSSPAPQAQPAPKEPTGAEPGGERAADVPGELPSAGQPEPEPIHLRLGKEALGIFEIGRLFDTLGRASGEVARVVIEFTGEAVYPYGLAVLRTWLGAKGAVASCSGDSHLHHYLDSLGFLVPLEGEESWEPAYDRTNHLGITPVSSSYRFDASLQLGRFLRLFEEHLPLEKTTRDVLAVTIAELMENVHRHAQAKSAGYLIAQVHPAVSKLHIVMADPGIGIMASFLRGDNEAAKREIHSHKDALVMACKPNVTSRLEGHSGYGLYIVSELAQRNGGTFAIASGNAMLTRWAEVRHIRGLKRREQTSMHTGWQGTVVALLLDLKRPLPILDIYNELGPPAGYEMEDFFE